MEFVRKNKTQEVAITEGNSAGLILQTQMISIKQFSEFMSGISKFSEMKNSKDGETLFGSLGSLGIVETLFDSFAGKLIAWNMVDEDGNAVPATREGFDTLDVDDGMDLIERWLESISSVREAGPLAQPSSAGDQWAGLSMPMEPLSENHLSLPTPKW